MFEKVREAGFARPPDRAARLAAFAKAYGATPDDILEAATTGLAADLATMRRLGGAGVEPWTTFLSRGLDAREEAARAWLVAHAEALARDAAAASAAQASAGSARTGGIERP